MCNICEIDEAKQVHYTQRFASPRIAAETKTNKENTRQKTTKSIGTHSIKPEIPKPADFKFRLIKVRWSKEIRTDYEQIDKVIIMKEATH